MNPLNDINIYSWIVDNGIKTETGLPLDFKDHRFMFDIYNDLTPIQAIMKAAQITASTCYSIKVPWVVKKIGLDAIYTLPTETDRNSFVGGKINRMIAQNPIQSQESVNQINQAIAQLQAGGNSQAIQQALSVYNQQRQEAYQQQQLAQQQKVNDLAAQLQNFQINKASQNELIPIDIGQNTTVLIDPYTGKIVQTIKGLRSTAGGWE